MQTEPAIATTERPVRPSSVDALGLSTSSGDAVSLDLLERAIESLFRSDGEALPTIERALAREPGFVAGHCARVATLVLAGTAASAPALAASLIAIEESETANPRERGHAAAARCWLDGDAEGAAVGYGELVRDFPRDRIALIVAQALDFRLGHRPRMRDRVAAALPHWRPTDRGYGYVLGMLAFGLEETGRYEHALALAKQSLELVPDNVTAIHVIAHVLEMRGPPAEGIAWLRETQPIWSANAGYRVHLAWHLALFQFDSGSPQDALATYDALIVPHLETASGALVDASGLLWRLQLCGAGSPRRWQRVTGLWLSKQNVVNRAFDLVYEIIALAASKRQTLAQALARRLRGDATLRSRSGVAEWRLARPLVAAIMAFCRGDYDGAVESISEIRRAADHCGGSVAQCDLIHLTMIEAALRGERTRLARTLATERAMRKPSSRLNAWLRARASTLTGEGTA
jgi:tetratricopeptide (TPR) repeat protein